MITTYDKVMKDTPHVWSWTRNGAGDITQIEIMIPRLGDHPSLITINLDDLSITEEGYD